MDDVEGLAEPALREAVNAVPGKPVPGRPFVLPEPAGPEGTFAEEGDGGLGHHHDA